MKKLKRNQLTKSISMALMGSVVAATVVSPAQAQDDSSSLLEEVIVSAQKRDENLQDVAISIQVLGNEQLENLNVRSFEDFIDFMPTVSYASGGPGFAQVYMRGIASGGDGNHSASMPSVGYYLDEQPVTTINQVLDIHMYDIARVETLAGPQGTLYGQGSQSGTIRIITNKPELGVSTGGYDIQVSATNRGDPGYNLNGFWNFPLGDSAAIRMVAWHKEVGGYIDQVPTTMTFPGPQSNTVDNSSFAKKNHNEITQSGLRALLKVDLSENWSLTPGIMYQKSDNDGEWAHNPEFFGDLETGKLWPATADEEWYQATLTLNGSIGDVDVVYAGAYLNRDVVSEYDYSDYTEYWAYYLTNPDYYDAPGYCVYYNAAYECAIGTQYVGQLEEFTRESHEVRFQSSTDQRFRWIGGLFYQKQKHDFDLQWIVPDLDPARTVVLPPTGDREYGGTTVWQTYQIRTDQDTALFGETYFDFNDKWTGMFGTRYFEYNNELYGFNGFGRHCTGQYIDGDFVQIPADEGGEMQYPCFDTRVLDDVAKGNDWAFKANLEYKIDPDKMVYVTWSEGFRAGGVNRARVPGIPKYDPDFVTNYEFGWKMTLAGGAVRFNGAAYIVDWDNFQFGFLDFTVSNLTIVQNVGNSQTKGVEWDLAWAVNDNNTLTFAGSYNNAELQTDFWRTKDLEEAGEPANAPKGTPMPYVPKLQLTGIWRSNFDMGSLPGFFQASVAYTGARWNDLDTLNVPARKEMDSYTLLNLSAGIEKDNWTLSLYINNLLDERAEIDIGDPGYGGLSNLPRPPGHVWTTMTNRPRTIGIRFG
ncbi:MAG: TonB-dependent receptor, partial [Gammaproteobacteria bacterium]|nr:TonB-dependent receptor [Gammaproteobacteria bacterium]